MKGPAGSSWPIDDCRDQSARFDMDYGHGSRASFVVFLGSSS